MNEPDIINNKYQLFLAMEETRKKLPILFDEFASLSGRMHTFCRGYMCEDADIILFLLGSSFTQPQLQQIRCAKRASALASSH